MNNTPGKFFTLSAPSGTGKTTLLMRVLREFPDLERSVSCTTRPPRPGEKDGVSYRFVDEKTFREMIQNDGFFEWEEVHGHFYGTPKAPLIARREKGRDTILDIDTRGAMSVKKSYPDSCAIFLMPPSIEVLEQRLRARQTESEASLARRLNNARMEMNEKNKFDYVIVNDELDRAFEEMKRLIVLERKSWRK